MLRVALLGSGWGPQSRGIGFGVPFMGRVHAEAWKQVKAGDPAPTYVGVKVVADRRLAAAREVAGLCGAEAAASLDEAIARADVDAVDICLPTPLHEEFCVKALRAGKGTPKPIPRLWGPLTCCARSRWRCRWNRPTASSRPPASRGRPASSSFCFTPALVLRSSNWSRAKTKRLAYHHLSESPPACSRIISRVRASISRSVMMHLPASRLALPEPSHSNRSARKRLRARRTVTHALTTAMATVAARFSRNSSMSKSLSCANHTSSGARKSPQHSRGRNGDILVVG